MKADVILPAAGSSLRMKMQVAKQFQEVCGHPIMAYTIDAFHRLPWIRHIVLVVDPSHVNHTRCLMEKYAFQRVIICTGGHTRHRSIFCGVQALKNVCEASDVVLIHDAARPFVPEDIILKVSSAAQVNKAAGVTRPLVSTVIRGGETGMLVESLDRQIYRNSEMPQAFHYSVIADAYSKCSEYDLDFGTECLLLALKYADCSAYLVEGTDDLWKVTYQKDLYAMESIVKEKLTRLAVINACTLSSSWCTQVENKVLDWPFKMATAKHSPANTFLVFTDQWTQVQANLSQTTLEPTISSMAESLNSCRSSSKIFLVPFVIVLFVTSSENTSSTTIAGHKQAVPQAAEANGRNFSPKDKSQRKEAELVKNASLSDELSPHPNSSFSVSSSSSESSNPSAEKYTKFAREKVTSTSCDHSSQYEGTAEDVSDIVPGDSQSLSPNSHQRSACSSAVIKLKTSVTKALHDQPLTVIGVMIKDSQESLADKLLGLIWHRASYLDSQLLDWT
ncbi:2-C-methyl-D-erythritol 4-phosphate cytidylyltransferase [Elysia marginata]|uniref:2-C-methyl-D-erythritol 4-phosphate cytidylyltransferase, chloroplastic n=1 Tax=Elysia marginata TaxID=1093978 RepID=A0AAV4GSI2_9GAST|nr:2-C-methyl-D-erythritol 4-phosphate cytidylyltransferase [Elysia marginata]